MSSKSNSSSSTTQSDQEEMCDLRRGPWTVEEDLKLINYIATHGEGRWNSLARCAGLKRTGKSCRLRWLNYLRPDVRRGNITLEEQLMILELHSRWGNRWSKIAQHLPGRTDNEIKNYWRTRVQKHAKQLKCDVNSKQFKDTMRYLWMPRLVERIQAANTASNGSNSAMAAINSNHLINTCGEVGTHQDQNNLVLQQHQSHVIGNNDQYFVGASYTPENSSNTGASSDSFGTDLTREYYTNNVPVNQNSCQDYFPAGFSESMISPNGYYNQGLDFQAMEQQNNNQWLDAGDTTDNLWNVEDIWYLQQFNNISM